MSPFKPLFLAGCTILGLATQPADALDPRAQRGLALARTNCTKCHAIGKVGDSPMREAPPFRTLHKRYPLKIWRKHSLRG